MDTGHCVGTYHLLLCFFAKHIPKSVKELWNFPREFATGLTDDYARDYKVDPGPYVEVSVNATVTNDNSEQTTSCVTLGPAGNRHGSVKCFEIGTGKYSTVIP